MDVSRVHGFFEGMAVAVSLVAVGFIVLKEAEAFYTRNRKEKPRDAILESRVADMLGQAIIDAHVHSDENQGDNYGGDIDDPLRLDAGATGSSA